ncbi:MAG TPA: N-6 DNA methylase [Planctomycetota bacterium]|nr:N-6 DNA methylase [Planctomycetota bacterium]
MTKNSNKYCKATDLTNEASVESFFVMRMLEDLGYEDNEILPKNSIQELKISRGRKKEPYKPDYIIQTKRVPRWLIDAKGTNENIEDFTYQCAGYALLINRKDERRPLKHYMLTNGLLTRVFQWDQEEAILSLRFDDFVDGNTKYKTLIELFSAENIRAQKDTVAPARPHTMVRPSLDVVKRAFLKCHRLIWKAEKMSPQAAFLGFAKLMFVKLWEDRRIRDDAKLMAAITKGDPLPAEAVRFSAHWIALQAANDPNPIDSILFRQLVDQLEEEIAKKKRKRIFETNERMGLSPGTVKRVVEILENHYLFGIDEDLNGRMFEAFLAATMRGEDLGQYFTPRSIVKMITKLAAPEATRNRVERVLDGCCGTGGFLIEVLTDMRAMLYGNKSLTPKEREKRLDEVANQAIFGIDAGKDPPLARIARINMYLHGDGGSRVYIADALRDPPQPSPSDPLELRQNVEELKDVLVAGLKFDVIVTNPPFSMDYSMTVHEEKEVVEDYKLRTYGGKVRMSLRSSIMFLERYWDLLNPGGRLLTVIDDSVLSGKNNSFVRDFIREKFIIRGVISLHGDAFQRAGARVKTSVLYLERKKEDDDQQPAAFVYETRYIGLDDVVAKTPQSVAELAKAQAHAEMQDIVESFSAYRRGEMGPWLVAAEKLYDRLDAKHLRPWTITELEPGWKKAGVSSVTLETLVEPIDPTDETKVKLEKEKPYSFLRISYEGRAEEGEKRLGKEVTYKNLMAAQANDIVVSNINAVNRAICVIPKDMEGLLISSEFTIIRLKKGAKADPMYLWSVLRSAAVVAEFLSGSSGQGRHRVDWSRLSKQKIPVISPEQQKKIGDSYRMVLHYEKAIQQAQETAKRDLAFLELDGVTANDKLARAKPPK